MKKILKIIIKKISGNSKIKITIHQQTLFHIYIFFLINRNKKKKIFEV